MIIPKPLTKEGLVALLKETIERIEANDSFEGRLAYTCLDENLEPGQFNVEAVLRFGNSEGQGFVNVLGDLSPSMKVNGLHQQVPFTLVSCSVGEEDEYMFLDLGVPGDMVSKLTGPRIGLRRLQSTNQNGWRIVLHKDDGDPIGAIEIDDAVGEEEAKVSMPFREDG